MSRSLVRPLLLLTLLALGLFGLDRAPRAQAAPPHGDAARGEYLVTRVATCQDCHSQRGEGGAFLPDRWLQGGPLSFQPTIEMPVWAAAAPSIAGLLSYTDEEAIRFLTTGVTPRGVPARPPMPEVRLSEADARDVLAYLRNPTFPAAFAKPAEAPAPAGR